MQISWEQLQTLEAIVRTGSVEGAARELGLRHSSVSRRVAAMEERLGTPLFVRGARLVPTEIGTRLCARAACMREHAREAEDVLVAHQRTVEGRMVMTTNDVLAPLLLSALASAKLAGRVEVSVSDQERELAPGVVDLALRPTHTPGGSLRGYRIGLLRMGVYRSRGGASDWVLPASSIRAKASMRWWRLIPDDAAGLIECDSLVAMRDACLAGLGRAILPVCLAAGDARLHLEKEVDVGTPVWLLSPVTRQRDVALRRTRESLVGALRAVEGAWR